MTNNLQFPSWDENTLAEEKKTKKQTNLHLKSLQLFRPTVGASSCDHQQQMSVFAKEDLFSAVLLFYISVFWSCTNEEQMAWCHQDHFKNENGPSSEWISGPTQPKTMPMNLTLSVTHHLLCQTTTPDPKNMTSPHPPASHLVIC